MAATLVIAHRGASGERPENTLAAYELAVEQRADMIEIDLHRTRDGAIVITHDEHLAGLPGKAGEGGAVGDASLAEVRALDAGGGERVPTLDEVLDGFGARIPFNLELKVGTRGAYPGLEAATLAALHARGLGETMLFSSFDDGVLQRVREADAGARLGVLVSGRASRGWRKRCEAVGAEAVHLWKGLASSRAVDRAHAAGLAVYVYTVDDPATLRALIERGVDGIFTNYPGRLRALLPAGSASPRGQGEAD